MKTFSLLANPINFYDFQTPRPYILNHRPPNASGLPVGLYNPVLARFHTNVFGPDDIEIDDEDMEFVFNFAHVMSSLTFGGEEGRKSRIWQTLGQYLGRSFEPYTFEYGMETDGGIMLVINGMEIPLLRDKS